MSGDMGECDIGIVPHPAMPVTPAESGGLYLDDDAIVISSGVRKFFESKRLLKLIKVNSFHFVTYLETVLFGKTRCY